MFAAGVIGPNPPHLVPPYTHRFFAYIDNAVPANAVASTTVTSYRRSGLAYAVVTVTANTNNPYAYILANADGIVTNTDSKAPFILTLDGSRSTCASATAAATCANHKWEARKSGSGDPYATLSSGGPYASLNIPAAGGVLSLTEVR